MFRQTTLWAGSLLALSAGAAMADYSLTILHTNDFHARFEPINRFDSTCAPEDNAAGECFGGTARLVTAVAEARARSNNAILVDGGDQFQGTLFYTYYKGQAAAEFMNQLGYDVMAVGNHEFDDGPEVLRSFVDSVDFPLLMANADIANEPILAGAIQRSTILERGGERLGFIGLTPQNNDEIASPGRNVTFSDPVAAVSAEVAALEAEGIDKIIVLSHSGYGIDLQIAEAVPSVDVIVGGHSHSLLGNVDDGAVGPYPTMVGTTAIVQAYAHGKYLGELNVTFDDAGVITEAAGEALLIDASVAEDQGVVERIAALAGPVDEIRERVVGETAARIEGDRSVCRAVECEMGNLVADAMLARVKEQGIQIAIQNGGGLRASIDAGPVTMGEVLTVLPFQNTLSTFFLTGTDVIAALENGVSAVADGAGRFPQVAGIRYAWDAAAEPGSRIVEVTVAGEDGSFAPIDPAETYGVVSNNFMRGGGDGYAMFRDNAIDAYDFGPGLEIVVADFLTEAGSYEPYLDGRIAQR